MKTHSIKEKRMKMGRQMEKGKFWLKNDILLMVNGKMESLMELEELNFKMGMNIVGML